MEKVLPRKAVSGSGCVMKNNGLGLYDIEIYDNRGRIVETVSNITFQRAVTIIEDHMYTNRKGSDNDGERP